jgi:hypothetical protein
MLDSNSYNELRLQAGLVAEYIADIMESPRHIGGSHEMRKDFVVTCSNRQSSPSERERW